MSMPPTSRALKSVPSPTAPRMPTATSQFARETGFRWCPGIPGGWHSITRSTNNWISVPTWSRPQAHFSMATKTMPIGPATPMPRANLSPLPAPGGFQVTPRSVCTAAIASRNMPNSSHVSSMSRTGNMPPQVSSPAAVSTRTAVSASIRIVGPVKTPSLRGSRGRSGLGCAFASIRGERPLAHQHRLIAIQVGKQPLQTCDLRQIVLHDVVIVGIVNHEVLLVAFSRIKASQRIEARDDRLAEYAGLLQLLDVRPGDLPLPGVVVKNVRTIAHT